MLKKKEPRKDTKLFFFHLIQMRLFSISFSIKKFHENFTVNKIEMFHFGDPIQATEVSRVIMELYGFSVGIIFLILFF